MDYRSPKDWHNGLLLDDKKSEELREILTKLTLRQCAVCHPFVEHHEHHVQEEEAQEHHLWEELEEDGIAAFEKAENDYSVNTTSTKEPTIS